MKHPFVIRAALALAALAAAPGEARAQAQYVVSPTPMQQFWDANGRPLAGGCVATYAAGTTTPLATAQDVSGTPNQNPVPLDSSGRANIWIGLNAIKYVVKQKTGATCSLVTGAVQYTVDNVQDQALRLRADLAAPTGAGIISFRPTGGTVTISVGAALTSAFAYDIGFTNATQACASQNTVAVTSNTLWSNLSTMSCAASLWFPAGAGFGGIKPASGATFTMASGVNAPPNAKIFDVSTGGKVAFGYAHPTVYPDWWGAVADGTAAGTAGTSQSTPMQAAYDAVSAAGGGTVYISDGPRCYVVASGVIVHSNTTTLGGGCVQKLRGVFSPCGYDGCQAVFSTDGTLANTNIWFRGFTIDGNRANVSCSPGDCGYAGIALPGASNSGTDNIIIKNTWTDGIYIDCQGADSTHRTTPAYNIQILDTVVTNSRRNGISLVCGQNVQIRGGELSFANGGSLTAGIDVEPDYAGQFVGGLSMNGVKIHNNGNAGILIQTKYDGVAGVYNLLNINSYSNATYGVRAVDFNGTAGGVGGGQINITGGAYTNNAGDSAINVAGWNYVNFNGVTAYGTARGIDVASSNGTVNIGSGNIGGTVYDLSPSDTGAKIIFSAGIESLTNKNIQLANLSTLFFPLSGKPYSWQNGCMFYWPAATPRSGAISCANSFTVNDGPNPNILISDGAGGLANMQAIPGAEARFGSQSATPACLESNNTCRVTADAAGNVSIPGSLSSQGNNVVNDANGSLTCPTGQSIFSVALTGGGTHTLTLTAACR